MRLVEFKCTDILFCRRTCDNSGRNVLRSQNVIGNSTRKYDVYTELL